MLRRPPGSMSTSVFSRPVPARSVATAVMGAPPGGVSPVMWMRREGAMPGMEPSGDANDSYHRYREDMKLLADAGFNSYRFGFEWARIEPRPGVFARAELAHYLGTAARTWPACA